MAEAQYIPELDYKSRNYEPLKKAPDNDMCGSCKLYYKGLFDKGITKSPFPPNCQGHISKRQETLDRSSFDKQTDYEDAKLFLDPIAWAYMEFGWEPRWYQERQLSCTADKKLYRQGRRTGKSESMIIEILYEVSTNYNFTVLLIAPFEVLVDRFFDEFRKFITMSQNIKNSISRSTRGPNLIEFKNGSKILGFSVGPQAAGRGADKVRGQDANLIVLDEIDTMLDADIDAILAILSSHPNTRVMAASTPRGWRKKFYSYCTNKNLGFKESWYVAAESPAWSPITEAFYKAGASENTYMQEYLADFGELEEGVFKRKHIDKSIQHYLYTDCTPLEGCKYILGVDWNKSAGTHMTIIQWDGHHLKLVDKIIVPESDYIQTDSVDIIINLNQKWSFKYIFVDAGYGTAQVELLRKYGISHRGTRLEDKVHAIHLNQNIEVKDPVTGQPVKKFAKPFIVMQTVKLLEDGIIIVPNIEDTSASVTNLVQGLVQQMREYRVESYSIYGLPRYSQGQDHTLTAFMLACAGFALESGDLKNVDYATSVFGIEANHILAEQLTSATDIERQHDLNHGWKLQHTTGKVNRVIRGPLSRDFDRGLAAKGHQTRMLKQGPSKKGLGIYKRKSF